MKMKMTLKMKSTLTLRTSLRIKKIVGGFKNEDDLKNEDTLKIRMTLEMKTISTVVFIYCFRHLVPLKLAKAPLELHLGTILVRVVRSNSDYEATATAIAYWISAWQFRKMTRILQSPSILRLGTFCRWLTLLNRHLQRKIFFENTKNGESF